MTDHSPADGESGFTLIEVLVAFAIVSICLASLYTAIGSHARSMAIADINRQTLAYARSHLATFGETAPAQQSPLSGEYPNGTRWRLTIGDIAVRGSTPDGSQRPFIVILNVFDHRGHDILRLTSIKMLTVER
jgi:general secretion pathway protein I